MMLFTLKIGTLLLAGTMAISVFTASHADASQQPKKQVPAKKASPVNPDIAAGKQLIQKSDCLACHKLNEKLVGPAYADVAKKYKPTEANINYLSSKIIKGGSGVWGQLAMSPHPAISKEDSRKIARYILSVK